jgi:hypothetical protein
MHRVYSHPITSLPPLLAGQVLLILVLSYSTLQKPELSEPAPKGTFLLQ